MSNIVKQTLPVDHISLDSMTLTNTTLSGTTVFPSGSQVQIGNYKSGTIATRGYVTAKINTLVGNAPETLNTLKEISDSLGEDVGILATMNANLALKANTTDVNTSLASKANTSDVTSSLALKANISGATFTGDVNVADAKKLTVGTGATSLGGTLTVGTGATSLGGALTVGTGATLLGGALTVAGLTTLNDNVSIADAKTLTLGSVSISSSANDGIVSAKFKGAFTGAFTGDLNGNAVSATTATIAITTEKIGRADISSSSSGAQGQIYFGVENGIYYIYICVDNSGAWKRVALSNLQ